MGSGGEDVEYESDPESLAMRRRVEASDDEGEAESETKGADRHVIRSDVSDGEGGVADYDDEEEEEELDEEEEEEEAEEEEELDEEEEEEDAYEEETVGEKSGGVNGSVAMAKGSDTADVKPHLEEEGDSGNKDDEEKKQNEPFAVPTAGAFYMHDDRFRDNAGARHRRMRGGRRLWESKDDRKWGHDKYEEIATQERPYKEGRRPSRGNYRGRGKTRGVGRGGYARGNRKGYDNSGNQSQIPKAVVRGRGPRRYEPTIKNSDPTSQIQNRQSSLKPLEKTSNVSSGRTSARTFNSESDPVPSKKHVSSNLNYASPPFYPSGASSKEINLTPKRDVQTGSTSRSVRPGVVDEGVPVQQNNALLRGKNVVDTTTAMDKLYIDESVSPSVGKPLNNLHVVPPRSSGVNASQSSHPRAPLRGGAIPVQMNYRPAISHNQVNKFAPMQHQATIQRSSAPRRISTTVQAPAPQLGHRLGSVSQASSPPKTSVAINSLDSGEIDTASESGKSKGALVGKGRGGFQGSGRGSFVYGGAMGTAGNMSSNHGDPNFPAFLPVMQFGGQHPGGIGVPAVGMAFPGYVAQPHGMGSSEMTWLPVLAGAAGALGGTYCPPYLTVDGAYQARQSGPTSAAATSSKENNANKDNNEWKPPQRAEPVSDEFGQRQNKPRRYSEMNFGQ